MLSKRCISSLTVSERQALQWLQSGKCVRCFHASLRRRAEDGAKEKNDAGTPLNAPDRGPTRQQRSAMVSREVEMLQRDRPHPTFNNPQPNTLRPQGAGQTVDPEAIGQNVGAGPMGHNDGPGREGPFSQGVDMSARTDVETGADTRAARSTGQPVTMEDAAERGGNGMDSGQKEVRDERITRPPPEEEEDDDPDEDENGEEEDDDEIPDAWTGKQRAVEGRDYVIQPEQVSKDELLFEQDGSTIAASNFEAMIEERFRTMAEPGISQHDPTPRTTKILARSLMRGQLVRFESKEEKAAVLETAKSVAKRRAQSAAKSKKGADPDAIQEPPKEYSFAPLSEDVQKAMVNKMVRGTYDEDGVLQGNAKYKQAALNNITRATTMNSTYLAGDGERLLKKVRSLLPTATAAQAQTQKKKTPQ